MSWENLVEDMLAATMKDIDAISKKRHDRRWLSKRMVKRRGDVVGRALAGSLLAAGEADTSTVSVYNSPIYGASSFIRRGNGKQSHMVGIQNFTHPDFDCWFGMTMQKQVGGSFLGMGDLFVRGRNLSTF